MTIKELVSLPASFDKSESLGFAGIMRGVHKNVIIAAGGKL